jgi:hypothetical protein
MCAQMTPEQSLEIHRALLSSGTMSQAAVQASAFYLEVAQNGRLWSIKDSAGFPSPETPQGRAMPFWSSLARVERIIETVPAYAGFSPLELTWDAFRSRWLPGLERDGLRVGLNWTGPRATGYDLLPAELEANVEHAIAALANA